MHPQLRDILGEQLMDGNYEGENTVQFKLTLCEILAERLAWKKIELSTRKEPGLYIDWRDEKDVRNIGDGVISTYLAHRNDAILKFFTTLINKNELKSKFGKEEIPNNIISIAKEKN